MYYFYLAVFRASLWLESRAIHTREWSQRKKMQTIRLAPDRSW